MDNKNKIDLLNEVVICYSRKLLKSRYIFYNRNGFSETDFDLAVLE